jgi:hypothetical protein
MRYPDCNCDARPGYRHSDGCASLTPLPEPTPQEREFNRAWIAADPGQFGDGDD